MMMKEKGWLCRSADGSFSLFARETHKGSHRKCVRDFNRIFIHSGNTNDEDAL